MEMEVNKAAVQPHREQKLAKVKGRLLQNRPQERFTNYDDIRFDQNLTAAEKTIAYQKAIDDATRRKIYFASLQGELLEGREYKMGVLGQTTTFYHSSQTPSSSFQLSM